MASKWRSAPKKDTLAKNNIIVYNFFCSQCEFATTVEALNLQEALGESFRKHHNHHNQEGSSCEGKYYEIFD